jgi:hypothetical protein
MKYYWIAFTFLLIILNFIDKRKKQKIALKIQKMRKGECEMKELAKNFIDKNCAIYIMGDSFVSSIDGTIKEVSDNGILIEEKDSGEIQVVNLSYVTRIKEKKKKERKR